MINHITKIHNIYTYQSDKTSWSNTLPNNINILSYQLDGEYHHSFDFGTLKVKQDCVFNIGANDTYNVRRIKSGTSICVTFTCEVPIKTQLINCKSDPRYSVLFRKLLNYRSIRIESNYYMALSVIYEIFSLLNQKSVCETMPAPKYDIFTETHEYLLNNYYSNEINLIQFVKKSGLSDKYFRESFKKLYGTTPTQFLINLRLNEAAKLLSQGLLNVTEVAETVGFSDVYYFSKLFKKNFSVPPSKFCV